MKKSLLLLFVASITTVCFSQNVAINADGSLPDASAVLDVKSTTKGLLLPRMTTAQRTGIVSPATGLLVYQTDGTAGFYYNAGTPATPNWLQLPSSLAAGWSLTGNASTNVATHFIGTTDDVPLNFRVNNEKAGTVSSLNTSLGYRSLIENTTGIGNTAFGLFSLRSNTVGRGNTAIGDGALIFNTTGNYNTAAGASSLRFNTEGSNNTSNGYQALYSNTTGISNTAIGFSALFENTTGLNNTASGVNSLRFNTIGIQNTANGVEALFANTTGSNNTANGYRALNANATGHSNVAVGISALFSSTNQSNLVAIGDSALYNNSSGSWNTAIGSKSLFTNKFGDLNTATGYRAMYSNINGSSNSAFGFQALHFNDGGNSNTAIGTTALAKNQDGNFNTAVGSGSLFENIAGQRNTAIGDRSLHKNEFGELNTAGGSSALVDNTYGSRNTANGASSLSSNTIGESNTAVGVAALSSNISGSYNSSFGSLANVAGADFNNATAIGARAFVNQSNALILGSIAGINGATNSVNVGIGTTAPAHTLDLHTNSVFNGQVQLRLHEADNDYSRMRFTNNLSLNKWEIAGLPNTTNATSQLNFYFSGMGDILSLKGDGNATLMGTLTQLSDSRLKTNILPIASSLTRLVQLNGYQYNWKDSAKDQSTQLGVLAQEVQALFPELVKEDIKGVLSVNYSGLVPVMVNAIKEQQSTIEALEKRLAVLEQKIKLNP